MKEGTELELRVLNVFLIKRNIFREFLILFLSQVDSVTIHPEYDADTVDNDVAMLRLPVTLTASPSRGIACLPAPNQPLPANQLCTIIGWGKSRVTDDFGTDILHEARVRIIFYVHH